jgi:hypothetical protein
MLEGAVSRKPSHEGRLGATEWHEPGLRLKWQS